MATVRFLRIIIGGDKKLYFIGELKYCPYLVCRFVKADRDKIRFR